MLDPEESGAEKTYTEAEVQEMLAAKIKVPRMVSVIIQAVYDNGKLETVSMYNAEGLNVAVSKLGEENPEFKPVNSQ